MHAVNGTQDLEAIEIDLLTEGVYRQCGYDFRDYARSSLKRRIRQAVSNESLETISGFQERVLHQPECMQRFLSTLSINVTAMFRDPSFYLAFRTKVVPLLRTYPFIRIWHAGCATGEEVYSLAILLEEEGIYDRCRLYATDISHTVLESAQEGIFPLAVMKEYTSNYQMAGGKAEFSSYYTAKYGNAILDMALKRNLVFSQHNLATDASFNEFNVILCRNVMIYFNSALQERVHSVFHHSLCLFGILGLGKKESLKLTPHDACYDEIEHGERLYRRVR